MRTKNILKFYIAGMTVGALFACLCYCFMMYCIVPRMRTALELEEFYYVKRDFAKEVQSPKILLIGGSNVLISTRGEILQEKCGRPVVNLGINAQMPLALYRHLLEECVSKGDIVVMPLELEFYNRREDWNAGSIASWLEFYYDILPVSLGERINFRWRYGYAYLTSRGFIKNFIMFRFYPVTSIRSQMDWIDEWARQQNPDCINRTSVSMLNQFGDEPFDETPHLKYAPKTIPMEITSNFLDEYKKIEALIQERGGKLLVTWPCLQTKDDISQLKEFQLLAKNNGIDIHGDCEIFRYEEDLLYDSYYHLATPGAIVHSENLADVIIDFLMMEEAN